MWSDPPDGRVFTIEEANALIPRLSVLVGAQLLLASEIQVRAVDLCDQLDLLGDMARDREAELLDITLRPTDEPAVRDLKLELADMITRYRDGWLDVQNLGAVVKDTNTGLLDFYGRIDNRLVWLCWKYGEDSVEFYHDLDTGIVGRKSLAAVRRRMLN
jgi:hypothetical protein